MKDKPPKEAFKYGDLVLVIDFRSPFFKWSGRVRESTQPAELKGVDLVYEVQVPEFGSFLCFTGAQLTYIDPRSGTGIHLSRRLAGVA